MKTPALVIIICAAIILPGSQAAFSQDKPEAVPYIRRSGVLPHEWYARQARLWQKEVASDPRNAAAWQSYYLATEYSYFGKGDAPEKLADLDRILAAMKQALPNSYEYLLMQLRRRHEDFALAEKAQQLRPDRSDHLYDLIVAYEVQRNVAAANALHQKLYESQDVAPALLDYNYNVLMSIEKDAILFTNGDNDTYPIWLLQRVQGIRTAVTVMNFHLITKYPDYLKKLLQERQLELDWSTLPPVKEEGFLFALCKALAPSVPVYVALTIEPAHIKPLADHLFVVGLAYQYSPRRFDNLSVLQKNWEQSFRLDYLTHDWYEAWRPETERIVPSLNGNYLAPLVLLIEHTKAKEEIEKSNRLRALAFELARKAGSGAELQRILGAR